MRASSQASIKCTLVRLAVQAVSILAGSATCDRSSNDATRIGNTTPYLPFAVSGMLLLTLTSCASEGDRRGAIEARYEALEAEQIRSVNEEEARRRAQMLGEESSFADGFKSHDRADEPLAPGVSISAVPLKPELSEESAGEVDSGWVLGRYPDPASGEIVCAILGPKAEVMNGELATEVFVMITADKVYLRTDATLDPNNKIFGLSIDDQQVLEYDGLLNDVTAVVKEKFDEFRRQIMEGRHLVATFRYLPQDSGGKFHEVELELQGIASALAGLNSCQPS